MGRPWAVLQHPPRASTVAALGQVSAEVAGPGFPPAKRNVRYRFESLYAAYRSRITLYVSAAQVLLSFASTSTPTKPAWPVISMSRRPSISH